MTVTDLPPVAEDATVSTTEDLQASGTITASDPNGGALYYALSAMPFYGNVSLNSGSGAWMYVPANRLADYSDAFTVTVTDAGSGSATARVTVNVSADNDAPTISAIADRRIGIDMVVGPVDFTIGDPESDADDLTLDTASSNTTLVPLSAITLGGSGTFRTVTLTPTAGLTGTATITITVSDDGGLSDASAFNLTVDRLFIYLPVVKRNS